MHGHGRKGIPTTRHEPGIEELFLEARPEIALQIPFFSILYYHYGMPIRGSVTIGILLALTIALIPTNAVSAQEISPGSACKVLNQKVSYKNTTYSCIKSGKKLLWDKGVPVAVSTVTPTPTVTPAAIAIPTPAVTPTQELETPSPGATCSRNKNSLKNC